jgi:hypothetical protein
MAELIDELLLLAQLREQLPTVLLQVRGIVGQRRGRQRHRFLDARARDMGSARPQSLGSATYGDPHRWEEAAPPDCRREIDPVEQQHQVGRVELERGGAGARQMKDAALQSLVPEAEPRAIPEEDLGGQQLNDPPVTTCPRCRAVTASCGTSEPRQLLGPHQAKCPDGRRGIWRGQLQGLRPDGYRPGQAHDGAVGQLGLLMAVWLWSLVDAWRCA